MNKKQQLFKLFVFFFIFLRTEAQIPANDPAWVLQTASSEEFNSTLDTVNKWRPRYYWGNTNNGAEYNYPSNLVQTGTTLKIIADTLYPGVHVSPSPYAFTPSVGVTYAYQSGAISSLPTGGVDRYKFGYLEGYAKVPTSYFSYWPALWVWGCSSGYNEIDYLEPGAYDCYLGTQYGTNRWVNTLACATTTANGNQLNIYNIPLMSSAFHKYATEWAPDRINYYFDDMLVRSLYDPTGATIPQNPMMAIINFCVDPYWCFLPADWNTFAHGNNTPSKWPQTFEIDYLRYYKLNVDCNTNLTICTASTDYTTRAVEKTIVTGGSCSPTFSTSSAYTLRATDYITLDAGTTVSDDGSGYFAIIIMACPQ